MQAKVFLPSIFIEQDPQIPSLQDLLKVIVVSISFFIFIKASRTIGPQSEVSISYVSTVGLLLLSGLYLYILNFLILDLSEESHLKYFPVFTIEFKGNVNFATINKLSFSVEQTQLHLLTLLV